MIDGGESALERVLNKCRLIEGWNTRSERGVMGIVLSREGDEVSAIKQIFASLLKTKETLENRGLAAPDGLVNALDECGLALRV